ncbi:MAG: caspase family protein [Methylococcales bacterium]
MNFLLFLKDVDRLTGDDGNARQADDSSSSQQRENWSNIEFGQYYALIIGNNEYRKLPKLDTPTNDARGVDEILRVKFGFKTQLLIDADRYQILSAMNEFRTKLTENDNLLIYYAGHGELDQVNMRGHWLPVDADADNNANWISTISITDILNTMSSRHILVIADSCYSGAMTRSSLARLETGMSADKKSEWLKAMVKAKSRTVLTSGGMAPVMDGGGGDHSVFANALIKALRSSTGLLEGQELYHNVSANVVAVAANYDVEQVPRYAPVAHAGHEAGEFFFIPKTQ